MNKIIENAENRILEIRKQLSDYDISVIRSWREDPCFDLESEMQNKVLGLELRELIESLDVIEVWKRSHQKLNRVKMALKELQEV